MNNLSKYALILALVVSAVEILARASNAYFPIGHAGILLGAKPWRANHYQHRIIQNNPLRYDPQFGWKLQPGNHENIWKVEGRSIRIIYAINPDGTRHHPFSHPEKKEIAVLGDSVAFGTGLADDQIFAAGVAKIFPQYNVVNLGVLGYGTLQALLWVKQYYSVNRKPKFVVYALAGDHADRNVLPFDWQLLRTLEGMCRKSMPYLQQTAGEFTVAMSDTADCDRIAFWQNFPLESFSLLVLSVSSSLDERHLFRQGATMHLLTELRSWTEENGAKLLIVGLDGEQSPYSGWLKEKAFNYLAITGKFRKLEYDLSHPAEDFHANTAAKIAAWITREQ